MSPEEIQKALSTAAQELGVSDAKLKAVYARGIKDCIKNGYPEAPYVHGLSRVQQFARAYAAIEDGARALSLDADLFPTHEASSITAEDIKKHEAMILDKDTGELTLFGDSWYCQYVPSKGSWTIYTVE